MKSLPGASLLIDMIGKKQKKHKIIIAFVISICLVTFLYSLGFIDLLKTVTRTTASVASTI